ncbi:MAG: C45 family peptidase [Gemmatimonadota bacterium]
MQEAQPGPRWREHWHRLEAGYRAWFEREGDAARPTYLASRRALRTYLPELLPTYERLVEIAGGSDSAARLLSLWCPTPYLTGCSQAIRFGEPNILVRNYDYQPLIWDAVQMATCWSGRRVVGMIDSLWGVLDGINEDGLVVSLAFGGRPIVGEGFGMPLILRYVLETCRDVDEGVAALVRVPTHMSYNVTLLDARGAFQTLFLAPDRAPVVTHRTFATNHQRTVEWDAFAHATASVDRARHLRARLSDPEESATRFVERHRSRRRQSIRGRLRRSRVRRGRSRQHDCRSCRVDTRGWR